MSPERDNFNWRRHPDAEALVIELVDEFVAALPAAASLAEALAAGASSHLIDWIDHLVVATGPAIRGRLHDVGFEPEDVPADPGDHVLHHPGAIFPRVILREAPASILEGQVLAAAIGVEDVTDFLLAHRLGLPIEGTPLGPYRRALAWSAGGRELWVVSRAGYGGFRPVAESPVQVGLYVAAAERWATRRRDGADPRAAMARTLTLAEDLVRELGPNRAGWAAFSCERAYWQRRNWAGAVQKARQDRLGLGWANHDHHTFRSSRETFPHLIRILETFGFRPRERFYAGAEAGWGAQVMEQPVCRFAVFADVDLSPDEVSGDFAHRELAPRQEVGTVGLWCALHGESMLSAGLHHLAARFDFDAVTADLAGLGVEMMKPFSDFSYLRQAFTRGERWPVSRERLEALVAAAQIDADQAARFTQNGALGSHLENIQRAEGFKGFNQHRVSDIIRRTDPRGA
jgi:hypothetical protein